MSNRTWRIHHSVYSTSRANRKYLIDDSFPVFSERTIWILYRIVFRTAKQSQAQKYHQGRTFRGKELLVRSLPQAQALKENLPLFSVRFLISGLGIFMLLLKSTMMMKFYAVRSTSCKIHAKSDVYHHMVHNQFLFSDYWTVIYEVEKK